MRSERGTFLNIPFAKLRHPKIANDANKKKPGKSRQIIKRGREIAKRFLVHFLDFSLRLSLENDLLLVPPSNSIKFLIGPFRVAVAIRRACLEELGRCWLSSSLVSCLFWTV